MQNVKKIDSNYSTFHGKWVKCVTRIGVGKPALGFYESLKIIYSSKTNAVKTQKKKDIRLNSYKLLPFDVLMI